MTTQPFRFIHAADLHLELPPAGLTDYPDYLEEKILEAPFAAARRLFQQASVEKVDFIILAGDVLDATLTGPYGLLFLIDEFEKLRKEGITVYWAGGKADRPDEIPATFQFPENVHRFPVGKLEEIIYERDGIPTARILGTSLGKQGSGVRPGEFLRDPDGLYSIGVLYGRVMLENVRNDGIAYWALGGEHKREFLSRGPITIHYPGATMPRSPRDLGDYGASLVEVNEYGQAKVDLLKISPVRWVNERVVMRELLAEEEMLTEMQARCKALRDTGSDLLTFVSWQFDAVARTTEELRYENLASSLLRDLRSDFAKSEPVVYSVDIRPCLPDSLSSDYYDQETILGDYLRMLHYYQENPDEPLKVENFFPEELLEYIYRRRKLEELKADQVRRSASEVDSDNAALLSGEQIRTFRPEVPSIISYLSLSQEILEYTRSGQADKVLVEQRRRRLNELRTEALQEAAMLGMELLSGDESTPVSSQKSHPARVNMALIQERRSFLLSKEGKESLS
ncbi:MAG: DNA repair exonuclease [Planctomycetia bacterium]|nr:DNA repair exonuclease [Planctomycetia bacterium]